MYDFDFVFDLSGREQPFPFPISVESNQTLSLNAGCSILPCSSAATFMSTGADVEWLSQYPAGPRPWLLVGAGNWDR